MIIKSAYCAPTSFDISMKMAMPKFPPYVLTTKKLNTV